MLLERDEVRADSRVRREVRALTRAGHEVLLLHRGPQDAEAAVAGDGARMRTVRPGPRGQAALSRLPGPARRLALLARFAWKAGRSGADAIHAHDAPMLGPAYVAARASRAALVYDTHEYAAGVPYHSPAARWTVRLLQRLIVPRCAAVITVSEGTAAHLQADHALARPPVVLRNVPELDWEGAGSEAPRDIRAALGLVADDPLVLHQGAATPHRGCVELVEAVALVPGAHLLFLGDVDPGYAGQLRERAVALGIGDRLHVLPGVPVEVLLAHTRQADAGVCLSDPQWLNHRLTLSNKVFEYIAAGLPVVATAGTAFGDLVERLGVGRTAPFGDAGRLAAALRAVLSERRDPALRERLVLAASAPSWRDEQGRLLDAYRALEAAPTVAA